MLKIENHFGDCFGMVVFWLSGTPSLDGFEDLYKLTTSYDSGRKASSTDYWVPRVTLVPGATSMLGENNLVLGHLLLFF